MVHISCSIFYFCGKFVTFKFLAVFVQRVPVELGPYDGCSVYYTCQYPHIVVSDPLHTLASDTRESRCGRRSSQTLRNSATDWRELYQRAWLTRMWWKSHGVHASRLCLCEEWTYLTSCVNEIWTTYINSVVCKHLYMVTWYLQNVVKLACLVWTLSVLHFTR